MFRRFAQAFTSRTVSRDLALGLAALISTLTLVVGLATYINAVNQSEQQLNEQANQLTQTLSIVLSGPIWNVDYALITKVCQAYLKDENVVGIKVVDSAGTPLFRQVPSEGDLLSESSPIYFQNEEEIGQVTVYLTRSIARANRQAILVTTLSIVLLLITFVFLGSAILLERLLNQPLNQLIAGIDILANGQYTYRFSTYRQTDLNKIVSRINVMAAQIEERDCNLEKRVSERTGELSQANDQSARRAARLQTIAEIARSIASIQDQEQLLPRVTQIISDRFGFYHVGIFLLDQSKEYAVLRAANSEGGQHMLARGHKLRVGRVGIVGHVTATGEPRIALDVGQDAVYFDNTDLPNTRSEMAIPLLIGKTVIGALDVQSTQPNAFEQDDIMLLKTLADQVSIAIENSRLYGETKMALERLQYSQRQYLQQAWEQATAERSRKGYRIESGLLGILREAIPAELWNQVAAGRSTVLSTQASPEEMLPPAESALAIPINLRGQIIGAIRLEEGETTRQWTQDEITLAEAVADQVALALENARLIEETSRRAEREHMVSTITTKLRSTNDPQAILQIAASELRQALGAKNARVSVPDLQTPVQRPAPKPQSEPPVASTPTEDNPRGEE